MVRKILILNSEFVIVQTYDEHCWHNGGAMFFDNEGYFYYTSGDAGGINDPYNTTQQIDKSINEWPFSNRSGDGSQP